MNKNFSSPLIVRRKFLFPDKNAKKQLRSELVELEKKIENLNRLKSKLQGLTKIESEIEQKVDKREKNKKEEFFREEISFHKNMISEYQELLIRFGTQRKLNIIYAEKEGFISQIQSKYEIIEIVMSKVQNQYQRFFEKQSRSIPNNKVFFEKHITKKNQSSKSNKKLK